MPNLALDIKIYKLLSNLMEESARKVPPTCTTMFCIRKDVPLTLQQI